MTLQKVEGNSSAFYAWLVEFQWLPLTEASSNLRSTLGEGVLWYPPHSTLDVPYPVICIWRDETPLNANTINAVFEVTEVPNFTFEDKLREIDLEWLRDTIVDPARQDQVYWGKTEGLTFVD